MKLKCFKNKFLALYVPCIAIISIIVAGCSGSTPKNDPSFSHTGGDIMEGPGFFTGEKGAFYVLGGDKNKQESGEQQNSSVTYYQKPVANMDLQETSKVLSDKIRQLEKDQIELELLKQEVDRKLKAQ